MDAAAAHGRCSGCRNVPPTLPRSWVSQILRTRQWACSLVEPGLWGEARCLRGIEALVWTLRLPGPEPLPPRLKSRPHHSWTAWQASGMPGMNPAVGLAQNGIPPPSPALPSSCCRLQGRNEDGQAKGAGEGSCFLCLPSSLPGQTATTELPQGSSPERTVVQETASPSALVTITLMWG